MSAVRRAHFADAGAARLDDVGDAERAAYFAELSPGNDDLPAASQAVEHEHDGTGVVVGHRHCLCPGELDEEVFNVLDPGAPVTALQIQL